MAIVAAVVAVAGAIALAHGVMAGDHAGAGMVVCLAVVETAAVVVLRATAGAGTIVRHTWRAVPPVCRDLDPPRAPVPRIARAGPAEFQVFRL